MHLILPMAGHGKRFSEAGYKDDKPLIKLQGKTLLQWSLDCIPRTWRRIGVLREEQRNEALTDIFFQVYGQYLSPSLIYIPGSTQGAAMTVLSAAMALPPDAPVAAMNCDQWFDCDLEAATAQALEENWDGYILTFPGSGPAWSYAVTNGGNRVVHVIEKRQVSPFATVGFYWWRRAGDLVKSICAMIASDQRVKGEFYLAPSFNFMPLDSHDVRIVPVEKFVGLGTPEQLDVAQRDGLLPQE